MQRKILSCFWKENILSTHRKTKQNKDCPASEHKSYIQSRQEKKFKKNKKKSILSQYEKFGSQHLLQTSAKPCSHSWNMARELRYFYNFALQSQCLQVSKDVENIPFHCPLRLFHLLKSELHWLYSLPAHSMFHLTFHLPNSPVHHIVVGYLSEQ